MRLEMDMGDWGVASVNAVLMQTQKLAVQTSGEQARNLEAQSMVLERVVSQQGGWRVRTLSSLAPFQPFHRNLLPISFLFSAV